jgi:hypothetical protein
LEDLEESENDSDYFESSVTLPYEVYDETNLSKCSESKQSTPKPQKDNEKPNFASKRGTTFIRKKSIFISNTEALDDSESEEEQLELNGDYILRKALLKDHDIQMLSEKEMKYSIMHKLRIKI